MWNNGIAQYRILLGIASLRDVLAQLCAFLHLWEFDSYRPRCWRHSRDIGLEGGLVHFHGGAGDLIRGERGDRFDLAGDVQRRGGAGGRRITAEEGWQGEQRFTGGGKRQDFGLEAGWIIGAVGEGLRRQGRAGGVVQGHGVDGVAVGIEQAKGRAGAGHEGNLRALKGEGAGKTEFSGRQSRGIQGYGRFQRRSAGSGATGQQHHQQERGAARGTARLLSGRHLHCGTVRWRIMRRRRPWRFGGSVPG